MTKDFWADYQPEPLPPPPECQTLAEKTAYAFGWWKALEFVRQQKALDKKAENARELGLDYEPAQQEPVANYCRECLTYNGHHEGCSHYTSPPAQRTWVGLTDEEIDDCWNNLFGTGNYNRRNVYQAIEAKLKEKNT